MRWLLTRPELIEIKHSRDHVLLQHVHHFDSIWPLDILLVLIFDFIQLSGDCDKVRLGLVFKFTDPRLECITHLKLLNLFICAYKFIDIFNSFDPESYDFLTLLLLQAL